jgi:hypothetical protein
VGLAALDAHSVAAGIRESRTTKQCWILPSIVRLRPPGELAFARCAVVIVINLHVDAEYLSNTIWRVNAGPRDINLHLITSGRALGLGDRPIVGADRRTSYAEPRHELVGSKHELNVVSTVVA